MIQKFHQQKEIDYSKIYVSIVTESTICMIFAVAAVKEWHIWQINFITVFLNELLHDNMYMIQSIRFKEENLICKLNQDFYKLKQSSQIWYETLMKFLQEIDFEKNQWNAELWFDRKQQIYLTIYVNDIKFIKSDKADLDTIHQQIANKFKIKNLNKIHYYLNMKIIYDCQ